MSAKPWPVDPAAPAVLPEGTGARRKRTKLEAQEAVVSALHRLIRENDAARAAGTLLVTSKGPDGSHTWDLDAVGRALTDIMGAFGYAVQSLQ